MTAKYMYNDTTVRACGGYKTIEAELRQLQWTSKWNPGGSPKLNG